MLFVLFVIIIYLLSGDVAVTHGVCDSTRSGGMLGAEGLEKSCG